MNPPRYRPGYLIFLSLCLLACSQPLPEEKQIRLVMAEMQQAAEDKALPSLMQHFHASFLGKRDMPKRDLQALIFFHFRLNPRVGVFVNNIDIKVEAEDAEVSCHLLLTGSQRQLPDRGRLYRVTSRWKKFGDQWLVVAAEWEDVVEEVVEELRR